MQRTKESLAWMLILTISAVGLLELLPNGVLWRIGIVPLTIAYFWFWRPASVRLWGTIIGGVIFEAACYLPPLSATSCLFIIYKLIESLKRRVTLTGDSFIGICLGAILIPTIVIWLRLWTELWGSLVLFTNLSEIFLYLPFVGAISGGCIFTIMHYLDFTCLQQKDENDRSER